MKKLFKNKYFFTFITLTCSGASILLIYFLLFKHSDFIDTFKRIFTILSPIIYGFVIAYVLTPLLNVIETKMVIPLCYKAKMDTSTLKSKKLIRAISVFLTFCFFIFLIFLFFRLLVPQIIDSIEKFSTLFPIYVDNTSKWINQLLIDYPDAEKALESYFNDYSEELHSYLTGDLVPAIQSLIKSLSSNVLSTVVGLFRVLWNLVIGLIVAIYMLSSKELFASQSKRILYSFFSEERANLILEETRFIHKTFIGFFAGKILDSIIIGLLCFLITTIMQTPYALLVSLIIGITNVIPFLGPFIGAVPSAILILMVDPKACLYFLIFIIILQQVDGNIIGPKILGDSIGLSGFWVIFSITLFGGLFGLMGIIIGVPFFAVIYAGIKKWSQNLLKDKGLPSSTTAYEYLDYVKNGKIVLHNSNTEKTNEGVIITVKLENDSLEEHK